MSLSLFPMSLASVINLEESFNIPVYRSSTKEWTPLNVSLWTLKIKFHYQMVLPRRKLQLFLHRRIQQMLKYWVKEHSSHVTCVIYKHSISNNHPPNHHIHFQIIDQNSKHVVREARKAIQIRIHNPALNHKTGKLYIPEIFNCFLEADRLSNE